MPAARQNQSKKPSKDELAIMKRDVVDVVTQRIEKYTADGELHLPQGYSAQNALKSAWLALQAAKDKDGNSVLSVCTRDSIANSLLDMIVQALNPAKKQCYFIAYGGQLTCQRSYFGAIAIARRMSGVRDVWAEVVYQGDEFEYAIEHGIKRVTKHTQKLGNVDGTKIAAAYAVIVFHDEKQPDYCEIMTWEQIQKAWKKSKVDTTKSGSPHVEYPDQMAMRTVINRATKKYVNSSSDDHLLLQHFNRADGDVAELEVDEEMDAMDGEVIDVEGGPAQPPEEAAAEAPEQPKQQSANEPPAAAGLDF